MKHRRRILKTTLLTLAVAAVAVPMAQAHPFVDRDSSATAPQIRALELRSQGMNALYSTAPAIHALQVRSEALNRANGLGAYQGTDALRIRSQALNHKYGVGATTVATSNDSFNWTEGVFGAAGVFATVLVLSAAIVMTRRRTTPLRA